MFWAADADGAGAVSRVVGEGGFGRERSGCSGGEVGCDAEYSDGEAAPGEEASAEGADAELRGVQRAWVCGLYVRGRERGIAVSLKGEKKSVMDFGVVR